MTSPKWLMYLKLAGAVAAALYAVAFVLLNARNNASVWLVPFVGNKSMPTLLVIIVTAALTLILAWIGPQLWAVFKKKRPRGSNSPRG